MTIGKPLPEGEDQSYVPKFKTGELVSTPMNFVGVVDPKSQFDPSRGAMIYLVQIGFWPGKTQKWEFLESELWALTWRQFIWHRSPTTGRMMVGKTPAFMAAIIHLFSLIFFASGFTVEGPWKIAPFMIWVGVIAIFWIGTYGNYTKRIV